MNEAFPAHTAKEACLTGQDTHTHTTHAVCDLVVGDHQTLCPTGASHFEARAAAREGALH